MERGTQSEVVTWTAPECPFRIEYASRVLDDIRLAVVDAFFSLPRGGAEIGGILLGKHEDGLLSITDYVALDCEHAMGPSFTLSPRDQTQLAEMIAISKRNLRDRQPVGWYHSHTRSEIFLSETDQDIHKRYFPEPWQVALVLKPHTFEPTRGGFFFREADGSIRGAATYQEFMLDPLPMRPMPAAGSAIARGAVVTIAQEPHPGPRSATKGRVPITREIAIKAPFAGDAGEPEPEPDAEEADTAQGAELQQDRSWRAVKVMAGFAVILALCGVGYQTREYWLPQVMAKVRPMLPKEPDAYLTLNATDDNGQMKIQWDRNAPAVRNAVDAVLEITDGNPIPRSIRLDAAHLSTGSFTYSRESERVDVALTASQANGQSVREATSFLGKLPGQRRKAEDPEVRKERDVESQRADRLQKDLNFQASKTRKLEKDLKDVRDQLQSEQRRRLAAQSPDPKPTDPAKKD